jgi:hypothetical protein
MESDSGRFGFHRSRPREASVDRPHADESPDSRTIEACRRLTHAAQGAHIAEHDSGGANPKVLHEWEHVVSMFQQAEEIGRILGFSTRQQALMKAIIAHHDLVIDVQVPPQNDLNALVVRNRGVEQGVLNRDEKGSEGKSADALKEAMEAENKEARIAGQSDVFTQQEIATAVWAIHATCPHPSFDKPFADFKSEDGTVDYYKIARRQNPALAELLDELARCDPPIVAGLLFSQIYLERPLEQNQKLPLEVFAIANADIEGSSLAKTAEAAFHLGDRECLELHHNWRDPRTFHRLMHGDASEDARDRDLVLNDSDHQPNRGALAWLDLQVGFAVWQALRAEKEYYLLCRGGDDNVNQISANQATALREDFSHAVANIRATLARAKRVRKAIEGLGEKEKFQYVAREMHFSQGLL